MLDRTAAIEGLLEPHSPYRRWSEEREALLTELWNANVKHDEIATTLGVTPQSVLQKAHTMGLPGRDNLIWKEEDITKLTELRAEGLSAGEIAKIMGKTRNMVMGKLYRLKLPAPPQRRRTDAEKAARRAIFNERRAVTQRMKNVRTRKVARPKEPPPEAIRPDALELALLDLGKNQCRMAITDDKPFLFCGLPTDGGSWCAHCARVVFRQPEGMRVQPCGEGG